ncbi:unnamed protein product [Polarella glacialis]|uniref:Uncharacterized protein n=3 Tax=Polarella glacialis TaxID=89957 RepID=A0A813J5D9_POLGL|nr:unnamed protein product [Polarella glacialis]
MGLLAEGIKDKEQAVLFGARCLSCNRVFDDVEKTSNTVNLRGERHRAQALFEIQRALHTPRTDPGQTIKLLAVKVGRPGMSKSKDNQSVFSSRDAQSLSYGIEDVQLLPLRGRSALGGALGESPRGDLFRESRQLSPPGSRAGTAPSMPQRPGTSLGLSPYQSNWHGSMSSVDRLSASSPSPVPRQGPLDFKQPLSKLVSRETPRS